MSLLFRLKSFLGTVLFTLALLLFLFLLILLGLFNYLFHLFILHFDWFNGFLLWLLVFHFFLLGLLKNGRFLLLLLSLFFIGRHRHESCHHIVLFFNLSLNGIVNSRLFNLFLRLFNYFLVLWLIYYLLYNRFNWLIYLLLDWFNSLLLFLLNNFSIFAILQSFNRLYSLFLLGFHSHWWFRLASNNLHWFFFYLLGLASFINRLSFGYQALTLWHNGTNLVDLSFKPFKSTLILHEHNLQVLVRLIVVRYQVIYGLHQTAQGLAVVLSFQKELLLGEDGQ